jgi:hypothetical protein
MRFKERVVAALVNTKATLGTPHRAPSYDLAILIDRGHPRHPNFLLPPAPRSSKLPFSSVPQMNFERKMTKQNASEKSLISMHSNDQGGILATAT